MNGSPAEAAPPARPAPSTPAPPLNLAIPRRVGSAALQRLRARRLGTDDTGAATAEYAIATMAAVAFAGLLVAIMQSDEVRQILTDLVRQALTYTG